MRRADLGAAVALCFGFGYVLAGVALLLQEFDVVTIRWSFVLPVILVLVGLTAMLSGALAAHRDRSTAGDIAS